MAAIPSNGDDCFPEEAGRMAHAPPSEYGTIRIVRDFCSSDLKSVPPRYPQIFPTAFSHSTENERTTIANIIPASLPVSVA